MKRWVVCLLVAWSAVMWSRAEDTYPFCQILDREDTPAWQAQIGYVTKSEARAPDGDSFGVTEVSGGGGLYYWRSDVGDIDLSGLYDVSVFNGNGGIDLPDEVGALRLDAAYVWRNWDGSAVKVDVYPGLYSDFRDLGMSDVYVPFQVLAIQAFNPQLSGQLGVAIYPGFDQSFDPRFGVRYAASDEWSVDLMYPESRVLYRPAPNLDFYAGLRNVAVAEYHLENLDERDSFRNEETRAYLGLNAPVNDVLRVMVQAGMVFNRTVDWGRQQGASDVEDGYYLSAGLGGAL